MTPTQPPVLWETRTLSLVVKRPKCETNRFLPSNVEVKNDQGHTIHLMSKLRMTRAIDSSNVEVKNGQGHTIHLMSKLRLTRAIRFI